MGWMMVIVYLAGPMTGYVDKNFPRFYEVAGVLEGMGFVVHNPADMENTEVELTWEEYMAMDAELVGEADMVVLLENWRDSKGARAEVEMARDQDMPVYEYVDGGLVLLVDDMELVAA